MMTSTLGLLMIINITKAPSLWSGLDRSIDVALKIKHMSTPKTKGDTYVVITSIVKF